MAPTNLSKKVSILDREPAVGLIYSQARQIDADGRTLSEHWYPRTPDRDFVERGTQFFLELVSTTNRVCCPSVIARRKCYEELGHFDPRLPYTADWEMWLRMALFHDVAYVAESLVQYRWHDDNETHAWQHTVRGLQQEWQAKRLALTRYPDRVPDVAQNARAMRRYIARSALDEAYGCYYRGDTREATSFLSLSLRILPKLLTKRRALSLLVKLFLGKRNTLWMIQLHGLLSKQGRNG